MALAAPASAPVAVTLAASGGQITVPAAVTIPAGQRSAEFPITGNSAGTAELTARGPDDTYETARAFLSVRASTAGLKVEPLWNLALSFSVVLPQPEGEPVSSGRAGAALSEELVFRVRDDNFVPYPGLRLTAAPSGGGSITPASPVTDSRGWARLRWTLDRAPGVNSLTVTLDGQPDAQARVQTGGALYQPTRGRDPRVPLPPAP